MQLLEILRSRLAAERALSGQHLVADHPERENVGASVHIVADGLLRRHVPQRSERRPLTRQLAHRSGLDGLGRRVGLGLQGLGEPKVEDLHEPVEGHHDVAGFQVTMDDVGTMRAADGGGDLRRVSFYLGDRHVRAQQAREGPPVDVLHRDEIKTLVVIDLVDGDDVGMVERRGGLGFPEESFLARRRVVARIERENLECDVAIECRIARQPHLAHAALSERTLDDVLVQRRTDHCQLTSLIVDSPVSLRKVAYADQLYLQIERYGRWTGRETHRPGIWRAHADTFGAGHAAGPAHMARTVDRTTRRRSTAISSFRRPRMRPQTRARARRSCKATGIACATTFRPRRRRPATIKPCIRLHRTRTAAEYKAIMS